jgi:hypothetical protein
MSTHRVASWCSADIFLTVLNSLPSPLRNFGSPLPSRTAILFCCSVLLSPFAGCTLAAIVYLLFVETSTYSWKNFSLFFNKFLYFCFTLYVICIFCTFCPFCIECLCIKLYYATSGDRGSTVVKVLRYKVRRSLFRSQMVSMEFFIDINPSYRTISLGSTHPLTQMSTRRISRG